MSGDWGPFASEQVAARAARALIPPEEGWSILRDAQNRQLLLDACESAGVALGHHDERILAWLSQWEDTTVMVIAGLITRAHEAGKAAGQ